MARSELGSGPVAQVGVRAARPRRSTVRPLLPTLLLLVAALFGALGAFVAVPPSTTHAADPPSKVTITAEPLLGGRVRAGEWSAVRVHLENTGPAIDGELRLRGDTVSGGSSTSAYAIPIQLATGARQEHLVMGKAGFFGGRFTAEVTQDGAVVATERLNVSGIDPAALGVFVVAERPEAILADIRAAAGTRNGMSPVITPIAPEDLPWRVEAWGAVDRLIWQDVSADRLTPDQLSALRTWITLGGDLVIVGGSAGAGSLDAFPDDLLPYRPEALVDLPTSDLPQLLGSLPPGATSIPALGGTLRAGTALATTTADGQDVVVGARASVGKGSVTIVGIDPAVSWLAGSAVARDLWTTSLRPDGARTGMVTNRDDGVLYDALNYLPSVALPPMDQLFLLFLAYVLLLGPISYLVLRRMDRREWAWVVMPALAVIFTVIAYGLGIVLKGTTVVVNELGVVRGAAGGDRGVADVYIGIFSPTRTSFDVTLPGGALLSAAISEQQRNGASLPMDILLGDPARIRDFQVGFGSLRGFRAQTAVDTPHFETDLQLVGERLQGTVRNASDAPVEQVAMVYGGAVQLLGDVAAGETRTIDVPAGGDRSKNGRLRALFADATPTDTAGARSLASRAAIVRQISGGWDANGNRLPDELSASGPVLLGWRSGGALEVQLGGDADQVGDTLYLLPVRVEAKGQVQLGPNAIGHTVIDNGQSSGDDQEGGMYLERGTMVVEYRPSGIDGRFDASMLQLRLGQGPQVPIGTGTAMAPLPVAQQPSQENPTGTGEPPVANGDGFEAPAVQLFDRVADAWVELPPFDRGMTYTIAHPERYVDDRGAFQVRYVVRGNGSYGFVLGTRLAGAVS